MIRWLAVLLLLLPVAAWARPVVIELYTSEACSDCPPADALLGQLKKNEKSLLALDLHVTYFNGPRWTDPYSLKAATERQEWYARVGGSGEVYTPEAVIDGKIQLVGSDRRAVLRAIGRARTTATNKAVPLEIIPAGDAVRIVVGGGAGTGRVWMFGFDDRHTTHIGGGENVGATLTEVNVVRSIIPLGIWNGSRMNCRAARPRGEHLAVVLQRDDGSILGAAVD